MKLTSLKISTLVLSLGLFITSCSNDDTLDTNSNNDTGTTILSDFTSAEVKEFSANSQIEDVDGELSSITEDVVDFAEDYVSQPMASVANSISKKRKRYVPEGAEVTKVEDEETGVVTVTIDFGEGVTGRNDHEFKGKVIITKAKDEEAGEKTVTQTFEDFYVNDNKIEGTNTTVRKEATEDTNKQSVTTIATQIILADDEGTITRSGTRTRELIEGGDDDDFSNNVYSITGSWSSEYANGDTYSVEITSPLIRKMECKGRIVQGTKLITKNGEEFEEDYGDGECPENDEEQVKRKKDGKKIKIKVRKKKDTAEEEETTESAE